MVRNKLIGLLIFTFVSVTCFPQQQKMDNGSSVNKRS